MGKLVASPSERKEEKSCGAEVELRLASKETGRCVEEHCSRFQLIL